MGGMRDKVEEKGWNLLFRYVASKRKARLEKKMGLLQAQFKNPALYEYLEHKYKAYPILNRNGHVFPVITFPLNNNLPPKLEPQYIQYLQKEGKIHSPKYRKFKERYDREVCGIDVEKRKKDNKDVSTYTMLDFDSNRGILSCGCCRYDDMLDSCEALGYELLTILANGDTEPKEIDKKTILRKKLHKLVSDPVRSGKERVCGLGISALLVFKEEVNLKMFLMRRGDTTVGLHKDLMHVIPSGMFQTELNVKEDCDVYENLYREYAEELFNIPHSLAKGEGRPLNLKSQNQLKKPVIYLQELRTQGRASLEITGLAVDLLTLRPEICMLLFIKDPNWYYKHNTATDKEMRFSWSCKEVSDNLSLPYSENNMELLEKIRPENTIPAGAAAFWLGIDKLREKFKSRLSQK